MSAPIPASSSGVARPMPRPAPVTIATCPESFFFNDTATTEIYTTRREAFYWLAVLFTFALGTAAGDLTAERLNVGYGWSVAPFAGLIGLVTAAPYRLGLNPLAPFWAAYIPTRPPGPPIGDAP